MSVFIIGDPHLSQSVEKPMDIFGGVWENYTEKLTENWKKVVSENDTVILAGDISWGMNLREALADFKLLDSLPGKKLLLKGNHDYWWETVSKMKRFLEENDIKTIDFIYNNSFTVDGISICGTRGWTVETENTTEKDKKIILREAGRLERSLASAPTDTEKIAVLHYPPIFEDYAACEILEVMQKYGVKRCFYGHLHSASVKKAKKGEIFGIKFYLVSADSIDFLPISI
ncbi:MAG: metallophosphoesterase [Clostridia bacterium]|nr:metallophosphoesterase [Clostridia bacterium]